MTSRFVNPQPTKGLFVFARIAEQLQRRRPDIPILVVESRGQVGSGLSGNDDNGTSLCNCGCLFDSDLLVQHETATGAWG